MGVKEREELLNQLDSLSKDARAAGYLLLITELSALSTLEPTLLVEKQHAVEAAAAREAEKASVQVARAREEAIASNQQVIVTMSGQQLLCCAAKAEFMTNHWHVKWV